MACKNHARSYVWSNQRNLNYFIQTDEKKALFGNVFHVIFSYTETSKFITRTLFPGPSYRTFLALIFISVFLLLQTSRSFFDPRTSDSSVLMQLGSEIGFRSIHIRTFSTIKSADYNRCQLGWMMV